MMLIHGGSENKTQTAIKLFKKDILGLDETCKDEKKMV